MAPRMASDTPAAPPRVPVGAMTASAMAGILAGGLGAKLLHDGHPTAAILLAPLLGLGLYALIRLVANVDGNPFARSALMLSATCFTAADFLVLAGEMTHPRRSADTVVRLVQAFAYMGGMLGAAALGVAIAAVAAWHAAGEARKHMPSGALAPLVVGIGLSAATFTVSMGIFVASVAVVPRGVFPYAMLAILFVLPFVLHGVWTYVYGVVLSRWEVETMSDVLIRALAELKARCGFQFDRVICLDSSYGNGRLAAVTSTMRSSTLIISEPLLRLLEPDELLALLAHETAHVELHHFRRKLLYGLLASAVSLVPYVAISLVLDRVIPRNLRLGQFVLLGMLFGLARGVYETFVTRRHEREADEYAARAAGAGALIRALEKLGADRSPVTMANRWTTHGTWEIRSGRLREMDR